MRRRIVSFLSLAAVASAAIAQTIGPDPTRQVTGQATATDSQIILNEINASRFPLVQIFTTVLKEGKPLKGLTAGDFRVRENQVDQGPLRVEAKLPSLSVVITLDNSGSMKPRMKETKEAAKSFLSYLDPNDTAEVIGFAQQVKVLSTMSANRDAAKKAIDSAEAHGNTALYDALYASIDAFKGMPSRNAVVLLSDGVDDNGVGKQLSKHSIDEVIRFARQANVPLYTIGIGTEVDSALLQNIAQSTGGLSFLTPRPEELKTLYDRIGEQLAGQYLVTYNSNLPGDGTLHQVEVKYGELASSKDYRPQKLVERSAPQPPIVAATPPAPQSTATPAPTGPPPFVLDLEATASGKPVVLSRPENGVVILNIIYSGATESEAQIVITAFTSESGSVTVDILDCGNPTSKQPQPVTKHVRPNEVVPLCLFIQPLPTSAQYTGRLIITAPGAPPLINAVTVQNAPTPASPFVLNLETATSGTPGVLTQPEDGIVRLSITYGGKAPIQAEVKATPFTSESGSVTADILDCGNPASKQPQPAKIQAQPNEVLPLCLFIQPLPTAAKYTGQLIITAPGVAPLIKTVSVARPVPQQGTLVLDHTTISQTVSPSRVSQAVSRKARAAGSVVLRERTGNIALDGISVRLEQVSSSPDSGFDLKKNIKFQLNGRDVDLGRYPPASGDTRSRTITLGGQSVVKMTLHDLRPGDYAATLRFTANNSTSDDAQKLQINIHVRDSVWLAVGWMIIALIISFISTKVLTSQRRRASLLQQIRALRPQWFPSLLPSLPVVWIKAVLRQAERLSRRFWLTSPDLIETNVNNVRSMLGVLDTVHQLRLQLESKLNWLVFRRVVIALDGAVSRLGTSPLTDSALQSINKDLDAFKDSLSYDKFASIFWEDIKPSLESLLNDVEGGNLPADPRARQLMESLKNKLVQALSTPPTNRAAVEEVYREYAKLRILWDQRDKDLQELIEAAQTDIVKFFEIADNRLWERIKSSNKLTIRMPDVNGSNGLQAYQLLQFSVETVDSAIEHSYLFRQKIEFQWKFELKPESRSRKKPATIPPLQPRSRGPVVVQYFPLPGTVSVSVKPVYGNDQTAQEVRTDQKLSIGVSTDFQAYKILAGTEVTAWLIAAMVAITTGLMMFYYKGTSWGTFQDYLTLFLWGIGVDQGKNFLQALQAYSAQPVTPSSGSHS
jgi:VWFA-related protein